MSDPEQLTPETITRILADRAKFIAGVQRGIEEADRGELIDHEQVRRRIERILNSQQARHPRASD